jgi:aryl-alcohol dehydrogenase-like predicted oxidoreductase
MIAKQIDRSLTRLKTDYVDLLQLHTCSQELLQQGEVIEVIERAKQAGKTRYIGYSGDNEAAKWAVESGRFDALQMSLNVMDQANIDSVLPSVLEKKVGLIIKRPIANAAWLNEPAEGMYARAYWDRWITLKHPELDTHPDEAVARALHFTLSQPGVCTAIVGSSTRNRFQHNLDLLTRFPHDPAVTESIRARFKAEAPADWIGLT